MKRLSFSTAALILAAMAFSAIDAEARDPSPEDFAALNTMIIAEDVQATRDELFIGLRDARHPDCAAAPIPTAVKATFPNATDYFWASQFVVPGRRNDPTPRAAAWFEEYDVDFCGTTERHKFIGLLGPGTDGPILDWMVPGQTNATPGNWIGILGWFEDYNYWILNPRRPEGCTDDLTLRRDLLETGLTTERYGDSPWVETWRLNYCGQNIVLEFRFQPQRRGNTSVRPYEIEGPAGVRGESLVFSSERPREQVDEGPSLIEQRDENPLN